MLPIYTYKEEIITMVNENPISILTAETGTGKSTQVPQYLLENGYNVVVTVPSRAAATTLCSRVSWELEAEIGKLVGFHTSYEKQYSRESRIIYTTDGLQLMKELHSDFDDSIKRVIIIDEIQEWGINIESMIAWVKAKKYENTRTKILLMSATIDTTSLSEFFDNAPVLEIAGQVFDIKMYESSPDKLIDSIVSLAAHEHNVLAFLPGRKQIEETIEQLERMELYANIFPMYADLPIEQQRQVFLPSDKPKIVVSTNVSQTSITIPDIDAVVDSGLRRNYTLLEGTETLTTLDISFSDHVQRKGRAGRTKPGIYVWCGDKDLSELDKFSTYEIYSNQLNQVILKFASNNVSIESLQFFHQPSSEYISKSQRTLRILGALDENNQITETGRIMSLLPLSVYFARMIVEANKRGVLEDLITITALQEIGGIKKYDTTYGTFLKRYESDFLAEYDIFLKVHDELKKNNLSVLNSINQKNYYRTLELRSKIYDILYELYGNITSSGNRNEILNSCAAGMVEFLYVRDGEWYSNPDDPVKRKLDRFSAALLSRYILGFPKNIRRTVSSETDTVPTLFLINSAIMANIPMLKEIASHLIQEEIIEKKYDVGKNKYLQVIQLKFLSTVLEERTEEVSDLEKRREILIDFLTDITVQANPSKKTIPPELLDILSLNHKYLVFFSEEQVRDWYGNILKYKFPTSLPNLSKKKNLAYLKYWENST